MKTSIRRAISAVSSSEGSYDSVNRNTDGAGLSVGIWQWPQATGGLGMLLAAYYQANPALFLQIFGPHAHDLLAATKARSLKPVAGALLWDEPWLSRFILAGRTPQFQQQQDILALNSPHLQYALKAARQLGRLSERSLAVTLDTSVTQGPEFSLIVAKRVADSFAGMTVSLQQILQAYLDEGTKHFRRTSPPESPTTKKRLHWRQLGSEWHLYSGAVNLWRKMRTRRSKLIQDLSLSELPI